MKNILRNLFFSLKKKCENPKEVLKSIKEKINNIKIKYFSVDDSKFENFDFHELTAGLSNSVTDQVYRSYKEKAFKDHEDLKESKGSGHAHGARNDFEISPVIEKTKKNLEKDLPEEISNLLIKKIKIELQEQYHSPIRFERWCDNLIKIIRWFMILPFACIFFVVLAYILVMFSETWHMITNSFDFADDVFFDNKSSAELKKSLNAVVASILLILDLLLVGSLVIMVLVGGYENTISRIGMSHSVPTWFGKLDIAQLKLKVAASIIIISSIQLLMLFMQLDVDMFPVENPSSGEGNADLSSEASPESSSNGEENANSSPKASSYQASQALMWTAIIHGVFVLSGIGLALMDRLHHHPHSEQENGHGNHHSQPGGHGHGSHHSQPGGHGHESHHSQPGGHGHGSHHSQPSDNGHGGHHFQPR